MACSVCVCWKIRHTLRCKTAAQDSLFESERFFYFFFQAQAKMWPQKSLDSQGGFTAPVRNHWQTSLINFTSELKDWGLTFCQNENQISGDFKFKNSVQTNTPEHTFLTFYPFFFHCVLFSETPDGTFFKINEIYFTCPSGKSPNKWLQSWGPWRWMDEHSVCLIQSWPIRFLHCQAGPARGFLLVRHLTLCWNRWCSASV